VEEMVLSEMRIDEYGRVFIEAGHGLPCVVDRRSFGEFIHRVHDRSISSGLLSSIHMKADEALPFPVS
jgi:hypothetical protein